MVVLIGCVAGGLIYRFVSIDWPLDSSALRRQIIDSAIAVILPPMIFWFVTDEYGPRLPYTIIGLSVGGSVACGIFVAGTRRS